MIGLKDLKQIDEYVWEIPKTFRPDMRVPARVYASRALLEQALTDRSVEQLINATTLPGVAGYAIAMPDVHQGYGFPVGGVAATALPHGVISPGSIGYDINCGVRLLASDLTYAALEPYLNELATTLYKNCPSGMGGGGAFPLNDREMDDVLSRGAAGVSTRTSPPRRTCCTPRPTAAWKGPSPAWSAARRASAGAASWARWARATISWRWTAWSRSTTTTWPTPMGCATTRSSC